MHRPWELRGVSLEEINENLSSQFNLKEMRFVGASFSEGLDVKFRPFIKMTELNKV